MIVIANAMEIPEAPDPKYLHHTIRIALIIASISGIFYTMNVPLWY